MSLETKRCTVAFVIFYDEERYLEECMYYIGKIQMPLGMDVEIIGITEETDFTEGVREAEAASSAEYKIYMDQHTLIIHDLILYDLLTVFRENPEADAVGILGGENTEDMDQIADAIAMMIKEGEAAAEKALAVTKALTAKYPLK